MRRHKRNKAMSLFEREMRKRKFREAYERERKPFDLEVQILSALEQGEMTLADLARKMGVPRSNISRDLSQGRINKARLPRIIEVANAVGADFVPLILPRDPASRRGVLHKLESVFA